MTNKTKVLFVIRLVVSAILLGVAIFFIYIAQQLFEAYVPNTAQGALLLFVSILFNIPTVLISLFACLIGICINCFLKQLSKPLKIVSIIFILAFVAVIITNIVLVSSFISGLNPTVVSIQI